MGPMGKKVGANATGNRGRSNASPSGGMGPSAMKQANSVSADFGDKNEFRPDLGGAGGNSTAVRSGRNTARDFPRGKGS